MAGYELIVSQSLEVLPLPNLKKPLLLTYIVVYFLPYHGNSNGRLTQRPVSSPSHPEAVCDSPTVPSKEFSARLTPV